MKRLFYIIALLLTLTLSLVLGDCSANSQPIVPVASIQNVKKETVVLISNNIFNGEISSYQKKNEQSFSGLTPVILSHHSRNICVAKNKTQINEYFVNNLSINKQKVYPIRAP